MNEQDELTPSQAAEILNVSTATVVRWADKGWIPLARVLPSGYRRFNRAEIEAARDRIAQGHRPGRGPTSTDQKENP